MVTSFSTYAHVRPTLRFGDFHVIAKDAERLRTQANTSFKKKSIDAYVPPEAPKHTGSEDNVAGHVVLIETKTNLAALENMLNNPEVRKTFENFHGNLGFLVKDGFIKAAETGFEKNSIKAQIGKTNLLHGHIENNNNTHETVYLVPIHLKNDSKHTKLAVIEDIISNPETRKTVVDLYG